MRPRDGRGSGQPSETGRCPGTPSSFRLRGGRHDGEMPTPRSLLALPSDARSTRLLRVGASGAAAELVLTVEKDPGTDPLPLSRVRRGLRRPRRRWSNEICRATVGRVRWNGASAGAVSVIWASGPEVRGEQAARCPGTRRCRGGAANGSGSSAARPRRAPWAEARPASSAPRRSARPQQVRVSAAKGGHLLGPSRSAAKNDRWRLEDLVGSVASATPPTSRRPSRSPPAVRHGLGGVHPFTPPVHEAPPATDPGTADRTCAHPP